MASPMAITGRLAMMAMVTRLYSLSCSFPVCRAALGSAAGVPRSSKLSLRNYEKFSAFFGDSFGSHFAFRGVVTRRVSEEKRRKLVGVVQAKRMASSQNVATRAPDFQLVEPLTGKKHGNWRNLSHIQLYWSCLSATIGHSRST